MFAKGLDSCVDALFLNGTGPRRDEFVSKQVAHDVCLVALWVYTPT